MDFLKDVLGIGKSFLSNVYNFKAKGGKSLKEQFEELATDQKARDKYNVFTQLQKGNLKTGIKPLDVVGQTAGKVSKPVTDILTSAIKGTGAAFVQTPLTLTGVNVPFMKTEDLPKLSDDPVKRLKEAGKWSFENVSKPLANLATIAKKPATAVASSTIGAASKMLENSATGKPIFTDIGQGAEQGLNNAWILAITNGVTNSILKSLPGGIGKPFLEGNLSKAWAAARQGGSKVDLSKMFAKQLTRGLIETPAETVGFAGWDTIKTGKDFKKSLEDNLYSALLGNAAFHGGSSIAQISPVIVKTVTQSLKNVLADKKFDIPKIDLDTKAKVATPDEVIAKTSVGSNAPKDVQSLLDNTPGYRKPNVSTKVFKDDITDFDAARDVINSKTASQQQKLDAQKTIDILAENYLSKPEQVKIGSDYKKLLNTLAKKFTKAEGSESLLAVGAGVELDESGNVKFDPAKAAAGVAVVGGLKTKTGRQAVDSLIQNTKQALKGGEADPSKVVKESLDEIQTPKVKRGFTETIENTLGTPEKIRKTVAQQGESFYNRQTNEETVKQAKSILKKGEDYALKVAKTEDDPNSNATAILLLEKYMKSNQVEKFTSLLNDVNPRFTKQGQQIQILSLYGKLTPTGAIRYTKKIIDEANKLLPPKRQLVLTNETFKEIKTLAEQIGKTKEGTRERTVAIAKLLDRMAAEAPVSLGQKISTIQTMAQLLNPKTLIRNTVGNTGFAAIENVKDVVATGVDKAVSGITGTRTKVLPSVGTQIAGAKEGFKLGLEDAMKGIDTSPGLKSQFDLPNITFRSGLLEKAEKALNVSLRATDRAAYTAAYEESLRQQMKAAGVSAPTDQMTAAAHADGLYRTFQDQSRLADIFQGVKKILNKIGTPDGKFGLGDLILKYPRTPANLLARGVDYSPAGFLKAAFNIYKPLVQGTEFEQKQFVENLSRSLVGTGTIALGYALAKTGIVTGTPEKDWDIRATQWMTGEGGFKFNTDAFVRWVASGFDSEQGKPQNGDTLVSYDWFQPQSFTFSMGVNAAKGSKEAKDYVATFADGLNSGVQTLAEQPLVTGLTRLAQTNNFKGAASAFLESAAGAPASFVPSIINQVGQATDNTSRNTYDPNFLVEDLINRTKGRIPGLRQTLPERIDVFGNVQEQYQDGSNNIFNVFFNPAFVTKVKRNPEAAEVLNIFENSGETQQAPRSVDRTIKVNGEQKRLTPDELQSYQTYVGQKTQLAFADLMSKPKWKTLSDEEKASEMSRVMTDINAAAKATLFGNEQKNMSKTATRIAGGLLYSGTYEDNVLGDSASSPEGVSGDIQVLIDSFELNKYIDNNATGIEKARNEAGKLEAITNIFQGGEDYEGVTDDQKRQLAEAMGYEYQDIEYHSLAAEDTSVKVAYIIDEAQGASHEDLLQVLMGGRKQSVGGDIFASDGVLDDLYNEGLITDAERKALKKIDYDRNGNLKSASGSGGSKKKGLTKEFINDLVGGADIGGIDALIKETKEGSARRVTVPQYDVDVAPSTGVVNRLADSLPSPEDLIARTKAQAPSGVAAARASLDRLRQGGSPGSTPLSISVGGRRR